jgi:hypothetical protein
MLSEIEKRNLYGKVAPKLDAIRELFKNPIVTLVVRSPDLPDGDFIMSEDDPSAVIASIEKTWGKSP